MEKHRKKSVKKFCRYELISLRSGLGLCVGAKFKYFQLPFNVYYDFMGTFREGLFSGSKIDCYCKPIDIKGQPCVLVYYIYHNPSKKILSSQCNYVTGAGQLLNLSGRAYTHNNADFYEFVDFIKIKNLNGYEV